MKREPVAYRLFVVTGAMLSTLTAACGSSGTGGSPAGSGGTAAAGRGGDSGTAGAVGSGGSAGTGTAGTGSGRGATGGKGGTGGSAGSSGLGGSVPTGALFEATEPWTKDVSTLPADARSSAILTELQSLGGWGAGNKLQIDFSIPLFFGDSATPRQTITAPAGGYCYGGTDCDPVPVQMPVPTGSNIEGSSNLTCDTANNDCHILVVERSQKKLYELYNATKSGTGIAALGAFIWDLTKSYPDNERGDQCTSADAAGFPIAGLLPTADEVASGSVGHALRFILPNDHMKKGVYVHPASHAGGPTSTNTTAPPYGVRLRLKASFDETPFNTGEKAIVRAMKTYGMLLSDGGNIALTFADDRTSTAKWSGVGISAQSFAAIKVSDFEVVDLAPEVALTDDCMRNP